ncbi:MAG: UDP-N-acetylmuramate dehydrogenase [Anaerolineales bacterium]|nr:UDP-N-acetylmuramate dehydrogenase [Anaerolineales bacterium]
MAKPVISEIQKNSLESFFGNKLKMDEMMRRYSVMQVGGPADYLAVVDNKKELEDSIRFLWEQNIPFKLIGGGSNTLISDKGIREVVIINKAKEVKFLENDPETPRLWAESGAGFGKLSRRAATKGWTGLEWSAGIPGTVGGAVVNNAGAFGSNVAENLEVAEILHPVGDKIQRSEWSVDQLAYDYRSSLIKSGDHPAVVLSATFRMERSTPEEVKEKLSSISEKRQGSQPQGASLGSMFKNPPGDYAGRLIEEAGLKGTSVGDAEISRIHGNFFLNHGNATAEDISALIIKTKDKVKDQFGVELELEIQYVGDWE